MTMTLQEVAAELQLLVRRMKQPEPPEPVDSHHEAWMAQPRFPFKARLEFLHDVNPWSPRSQGFRYYETLLKSRATTIDEAIAVAVKMGITRSEAQKHLRWIYTWVRAKGFPFIAVDGKTYGANGD
jgi:hypothetical protein